MTLTEQCLRKIKLIATIAKDFRTWSWDDSNPPGLYGYDTEGLCTYSRDLTPEEQESLEECGISPPWVGNAWVEINAPGQVNEQVNVTIEKGRVSIYSCDDIDHLDEPFEDWYD
jgi:hypothetical protein